MQVWPGKAERLKAIDRIERTRCAEAETSQDLGSAADIRETRRLRRELARAERHVEQLERRLATLRRKAIPKPARKPVKVASAFPAQPVRMQAADTADFEPTSSEPAIEIAAGRSGAIESGELPSFDSISANAVSDPAQPAGNTPLRDKNGRRPDPRKVAKAWRANSKPGFRKPGSTKPARPEFQATTHA